MEFEQVAGMESINHEFDNTYNLAAGLESIIATGPASSYEGVEARYTHTVLTLNGIDVSGQEGFLDGIKKGAMKVYEWIKDLIKTIRSWFTGPSKAQYEKDKKEIKEVINQVNINRTKDLKDKGVDEFVKQMTDVIGVPAASADPIVKTIKRMSPDEKKAVNEAIKEVDIPNVSTPQELDDSIKDTVINEISLKLKSKFSQLENKIKEIKRIDQTGETGEFMNIAVKWDVLEGIVKSIASEFEREDQKKFSSRIAALIKISDDAQAEVANATVNMDRLNEKYKGHEHTSEGKKLSRAVAILKLLTEIADLYRTIIVGVSKDLREGYKKASSEIVKSAMNAARVELSNAMDKFIEKDLKDLGISQ